MTLPAPAFPPGLFRLISSTRAGGRVELIDHDRERRWFLIRARAWDSQRGEVSHVAIQRYEDGEMGQTYVATAKGFM